ncbi:MAG: dephospho-CoA kinase [Butyricicoccus sp.]|nr:dephospho-CoA kinase [Butyricicoccus sp.]
MTVIGITGPTGAGKTTALNGLKKRGFEVIDCDRLYDSLLAQDEDLRGKLRAAFGDVFRSDGQLDRPGLARRVFGDSKELAKLNSIVFPVIYRAVEGKIAKSTQKGIAIDAINLVESSLGQLCDVTVAITADPAIRLKRIMARDGIDEERAKARIAAQKPDKFYRKNCSFVLENRAGSGAEFERLMDEFMDNILFMEE